MTNCQFFQVFKNLTKLTNTNIEKAENNIIRNKKNSFEKIIFIKEIIDKC